MSDDVLKQGGYVVLDSESVLDAKGYAISGAGTSDAFVKGTTANAVLNNPAVVTNSNTSVVLSNPAIATASSTYAVFGSLNSVATTDASYVVLKSFYPPSQDITLDYRFIDQRLPECISYGSQGGPGFKTSVFEFDSGITSSHIDWNRMRARYEVTLENVTSEDVEELENFFYGMRGKAIGFRFKDWSDYQITRQNVGIGDGESIRFQVFKRYQSGSHIFDRIIKKTAARTIELTQDGSPLSEGYHFYMADSEGQIVFTTPPPMGAIIQIQYLEFDVPVRFDTDRLNLNYSDFRQQNTSLELVEVLL